MAQKKKATEPAADEKKFEEAMEELEDVVERLEGGDIPLEASLAAFERGVSLVRLLHARLDAVQTRIEELTRNERGEAVAKPLDDD